MAKDAVKIMVTVQWADDTYAPTRIMSDAVTGIDEIEVDCIRRPEVVRVLVPALIESTLAEWLKKEIP